MLSINLTWLLMMVAGVFLGSLAVAMLLHHLLFFRRGLHRLSKLVSIVFGYYLLAALALYVYIQVAFGTAFEFVHLPTETFEVLVLVLFSLFIPGTINYVYRRNVPDRFYFVHIVSNLVAAGLLILGILGMLTW